MWARRPPNRPHDPTEPGAPAPKLLPSPPKVPPPPATPKASKYSSVRQNELEELRQRGLAKLFNKHFTTVTQQIAVERAAADKALKDLEARRLSEFKETNYGATMSNYDQMVLELQRKRDECKRKERETLLLYQRYVHKFGNKAGAMAVPSMSDAAAIPEEKELQLPPPPLMAKREEDPTSGLHVPDRTDEIETNLQEYMDKGAQRHPSIRDLGVSETYKTLQDAMEQQERDFLKKNTSTTDADVKSSPVRKSKRVPGSLGQRGSQFENDTTILHEPGEMPPPQQPQQQEETPQTPVPQKQQPVDSATDAASSTTTATTTITSSSSDNHTGGDKTPPPTKSTITTTEADEAANKMTATTSSSLLPPPLVASTPGSSSSTLAPTPAKATTTAVVEQTSSTTTTTTTDVASATAAIEQRELSTEEPSNTSNAVTFEEKQQAEVSSSSASSYNEHDDDFLVRDDHALHNVSMSTTDDDIMSAHSAVSGLTSVEIISDAEMKLLDFLRTETEAIRQMLDEQEDAASVKSSHSSSPAPHQDGKNVSVSALALQYGHKTSSSTTSTTGSVTDNILVTDDMSETQRATLQAEEMVREMQRVLEEAQAEQQQHHQQQQQQQGMSDNPNTHSDTFSTWTPPNTKKSSSSSLYSAGGTSTTTPVSVQKEPYRLETTNPNEQWMVYYDDQHQRKYYHEVNSNIVQWEKPSTAKPVQPSSLLASAAEGGNLTENTNTNTSEGGGRASSPTLSRASPVTVRSMNTTVSTDDHDYVPLKDYSKKKNKSKSSSSDAGSVTSYRSGGAASYSSGPLFEDDSTTNVPGSTTSSARGAAAPTIMSGVSTESQLLSYEDVMPETGGGHRPGLLRSPSGGGGGVAGGVSRRVLYRRQQRRKRNRRRVALLAGAVVAVTASVYCKKEIATVVDVLVPDSVEYQLHHVMTNHVNHHVPTFMQWTSSKVRTKELQEKARLKQDLKQQQEALELKKRQEMEHQAKLEKERQAKVEAARQAKLQAQLEAERKAKEEAALKRKLESEIRAKLEAEQKAKEEALIAQRKAKEAAEAAVAQQKAAEADAESQRIKEETARQAAQDAEIAQQTMEVERKAREDSEAALAMLETSADGEDDYEIALQYKERPMVCNVPLSYVIPGKCRRMAKSKPIYDVTSLVGSMMQ